MIWIIEGKVSSFTVDNTAKIIFTIKALHDYQVKHNNKCYNAFINTSNKGPLQAFLGEEDRKLEARGKYNATFCALRDGAGIFVFEGSKDGPTKLKSLTVKYQ